MSLSCNRIIIFPWLKIVFLFWIISLFGALRFLLLMTKTSTSSLDMFLIYLQKGNKRPYHSNHILTTFYSGFFLATWLRQGCRQLHGGIGDAGSTLIERDWLTECGVASRRHRRDLYHGHRRPSHHRPEAAHQRSLQTVPGEGGSFTQHLLSTLPSVLSVSSCKAGFPSCWALTD